MTPAPTLPRELLAEAFSNPRLVRAFEQQAQVLNETQVAAADNVSATENLQDATFITLSPNTALNNERVLKLGIGLRFAAVGPQEITIAVSDAVAKVAGGFPVQLTAQAPTAVVLPLSGILATRANSETLSNKTLHAPLIENLKDAPDDAAAAASGVPVNAVYRTGSILKVRIA